MIFLKLTKLCAVYTVNVNLFGEKNLLPVVYAGLGGKMKSQILWGVHRLPAPPPFNDAPAISVIGCAIRHCMICMIALFRIVLQLPE